MKKITTMLTAALLLATTVAAAQNQQFRPFILAWSGQAELQAKTEEVISSLEAAGFEIAGQYSPMPGTNLIVATSEELLRVAASTDRGGYAAGQRVSVTQTDDGVEVAFANPKYLQHAYRISDSMDGVYEALAGALGQERQCSIGNKKMTARKLGKYNYMMGMQKFDDPSELGSFGSYEAALAAVENGLAVENDGIEMVYRIDIPGKEQSVIGVSMKTTADDERKIDESAQMQVVDFEGCRKRAYFPYEILVNGGEVEALHMRFRMAVHFPNLSMMGKHGFTKLMPYPGDIEEALEGLVQGN